MLLIPEGKFNNIYDAARQIQRPFFTTSPLAISFDSLIKNFLGFKSYTVFCIAETNVDGLSNNNVLIHIFQEKKADFVLLFICNILKESTVFVSCVWKKIDIFLCIENKKIENHFSPNSLTTEGQLLKLLNSVNKHLCNTGFWSSITNSIHIKCIIDVLEMRLFQREGSIAERL